MHLVHVAATSRRTPPILSTNRLWVSGTDWKLISARQGAPASAAVLLAGLLARKPIPRWYDPDDRPSRRFPDLEWYPHFFPSLLKDLLSLQLASAQRFY